MKKVIIISYYFQKKEAIGSIRLRGLAKYLPLYGWDATILSGTSGKNDGFDVTEIVSDDITMGWKKMLQ